MKGNKNKRKFHCAFMGRVWSIDRAEVLPWLKKQMESNHGKGEERFCFKMDGWRELQQKPTGYLFYFRPDKMEVKSVKTLIGEMEAGVAQIEDYFS